MGFLSFEDSIVKHPDCFLYLDPPYYLEDKSKLYGKNGDMHLGFDHQLLCDLLKNRDNWLLSYNDCEVIRELYKDFAGIVFGTCLDLIGGYHYQRNTPFPK